MSALTRYGASRDDLAALLDGLPRYRVDQVWQGLYEQLAAPEELTALPKALRAELAAALPARPRGRRPSAPATAARP